MNWFSRVLLISLVLCAAGQANPAATTNAKNSGDFGAGNGGTELGIEWTQLAEEAHTGVKDHPHVFPEIDINKLRDAIDETRVIFEKTLEDGLEKRSLVALNFPKKKLILVDEKKWKVIPTRESKKILVLHEYLGILEVEKDNYAISNRLSSISPPSSNPSTRGKSKDISSVFGGQGEFFIINEKKSYVLKLDLAKSNSGTIVFSDGASGVFYKKAGNKMEVTLGVPHSTVGFESRQFNGKSLVVQAEYILEKYIFLLTDEGLSVTEMGRVSYKEDDGVNVPNIVTEPFSYTVSELTVKNRLNEHKFDFAVNDSIVVPVQINSGSVELKLEPANLGTIQDKGSELKATMAFWSLQNSDTELNINFDDGNSLKYWIYSKGLASRVVVYNRSASEHSIRFSKIAKVEPGHYVKDEESFRGVYESIGSGRLSTIYYFSKNGNGGFWARNQSEGSKELTKVQWHWWVEKGQVRSKRFFKLDQGGNRNGIARSQKDLQDCVDKKTKCEIFTQRSYRIIGKKDGKIVALRKFKATGQPERISVWVFNKIEF